MSRIELRVSEGVVSEGQHCLPRRMSWAEWPHDATAEDLAIVTQGMRAEVGEQARKCSWQGIAQNSGPALPAWREHVSKEVCRENPKEWRGIPCPSPGLECGGQLRGSGVLCGWKDPLGLS